MLERARFWPTPSFPQHRRPYKSWACGFFGDPKNGVPLFFRGPTKWCCCRPTKKGVPTPKMTSHPIGSMRLDRKQKDSIRAPGVFSHRFTHLLGEVQGLPSEAVDNAWRWEEALVPFGFSFDPPQMSLMEVSKGHSGSDPNLARGQKRQEALDPFGSLTHPKWCVIFCRVPLFWWL